MFILFTFFLTLIIGLIAATLTSIDLVLLLVIAYTVGSSAFNALVYAFLSGLFFDLLKGEKLGVTSIIYLAVSFLILLYRVKFKQTRAFYLIPFTFLISSLLNYVKFANFFWGRSLFLSILILPVNLGILLIKERIKNRQRRLEI